jgi:hypothetical protein
MLRKGQAKNCWAISSVGLERSAMLRKGQAKNCWAISSVGLERSAMLRKGQAKNCWAISSVGLERLPYKQEVTGSNPVSPTKRVEFYNVEF